jgi:hypothetical protein
MSWQARWESFEQTDGDRMVRPACSVGCVVSSCERGNVEHVKIYLVNQ